MAEIHHIKTSIQFAAAQCRSVTFSQFDYVEVYLFIYFFTLWRSLRVRYTSGVGSVSPISVSYFCSIGEEFILNSLTLGVCMCDRVFAVRFYVTCMCTSGAVCCGTLWMCMCQTSRWRLCSARLTVVLVKVRSGVRHNIFSDSRKQISSYVCKFMYIYPMFMTSANIISVNLPLERC